MFKSFLFYSTDILFFQRAGYVYVCTNRSICLIWFSGTLCNKCVEILCLGIWRIIFKYLRFCLLRAHKRLFATYIYFAQLSPHISLVFVKCRNLKPGANICQTNFLLFHKCNFLIKIYI